ncbi:hypothetical protein PGB90_002906 [Kerria lacca]
MNLRQPFKNHMACPNVANGSMIIQNSASTLNQLNLQSYNFAKKFFKNDIHYTKFLNNVDEYSNSTSESLQKILKIAIIGVPNSGKSTLINQIVGRNVLAISKKVHTTRCHARAVLICDNTQLIFVDTPGLVTVKESVKHHLERSFLTDSEEAIKESDLIGVLHDVSNKYTMYKLDPKVLRLLYLYQNKPSFLILNKVDTMKSKRELLDCVRILTGQSNERDQHSYHGNSITEAELQDIVNEQSGWPHFKDVFMISALTGDGVGDIQLYLMKFAKYGKWIFPSSVFTDQNEVTVIRNCVFSKLLDYLPNVIPYNLGIEIEYMNIASDGSVIAIILINTKNERIKNMVLGKGGSTIRKIATEVEQSLRTCYLNDVRIKLVVQEKANFKQNNKNDHFKQNNKNDPNALIFDQLG